MEEKFKQEVDEEIAQCTYAYGKILKRVIVTIVIITIVSSVVGVGFKAFKTNTDRIIFKQSLTYNEGVLDDLAKYKFEMVQAEDDIEKNAIAEMVVQRFANYDESKIETYDLKQFLNDCRNLNLEDY